MSAIFPYMKDLKLLISPKSRKTFYEKISKEAHPDGCHIWCGSWAQTVMLSDGSKHKAKAHNIIWELEIGEVPGAHTVTCVRGNPNCINMQHLDLVSKKERTTNRAKQKKLTSEEIAKIKSMFKTHKTWAIAQEFGIYESYVSLIRSGKIHNGSSCKKESNQKEEESRREISRGARAYSVVFPRIRECDGTRMDKQYDGCGAQALSEDASPETQRSCG